MIQADDTIQNEVNRQNMTQQEKEKREFGSQVSALLTLSRLLSYSLQSIYDVLTQLLPAHCEYYFEFDLCYKEANKEEKDRLKDILNIAKQLEGHVLLNENRVCSYSNLIDAVTQENMMSSFEEASYAIRTLLLSA